MHGTWHAQGTTCTGGTLTALALTAAGAGVAVMDGSAERVFGVEARAVDTVREGMPEIPNEADAGALWDFLEDAAYTHWAPYRGQDGSFFEGGRAHGARLKVYVNRAVAGDWENPPPGSIIVKENYTPSEELAAITVMQRIADYNGEHGDWFWVKYGPEGEVMDDEDGAELAGKVTSCIACHARAGGGDYIFANDR